MPEFNATVGNFYGVSATTLNHLIKFLHHTYGTVQMQPHALVSEYITSA